MATIQQFEEIEAWQSAREVVAEVYSITREGEFGRHFGLHDPRRRAAASIMPNIAEGFSWDSSRTSAHASGN